MKRRSTRQALAALVRGARPLFALRWMRVVLVLGVFALIVRLTLGLMLAGAIDALIGSRGLTCSWNDLDLSIFSGRGEVHDLRLVPRPKAAAGAAAEEPIVVVEYAVFDLELLPLFVGKLRVRRLEVDGAEVRVARAADGTWNLARHLEAPSESAGNGAKTAHIQPEKQHIEPEPIVLAPPFSVEALRVQDVYVRLTDHQFEPVIEHVFHVDAAVSNLWSASRRARFSATVTADKILDGAHFEGEADWTSRHIALDVRAQLGGLRPRAIAPYLAALGIHPACDAIEGGLGAHVELTVAGAAGDALRGSAELTDLRLAADEVEALALERADVEVESLSSAGAAITRIELEGARASASLELHDALRIAGLDLSIATPEPGQGSWLQSLTDVFDIWIGHRVPAWASLLVHDDPHAFPWKLGSFALRRSEVLLVDRRVAPAAEFPVIIDEVELHDVVHARASGTSKRL